MEGGTVLASTLLVGIYRAYVTKDLHGNSDIYFVISKNQGQSSIFFVEKTVRPLVQVSEFSPSEINTNWIRCRNLKRHRSSRHQFHGEDILAVAVTEASWTTSGRYNI